MTIKQLSDYFEDICLRHKDIKAFSYGSNFDIAVSKNDLYPQAFLEFPFLTDFNLEVNQFVDDVQIALNIFISTNADDIPSDLFGISIAKEIGDAIVMYINENCDDFKIESASGLSLREFSDDSLCGMRYDLIIKLPRTCYLDWNEVFKLD